jgi:hypothetical protein
MKNSAIRQIQSFTAIWLAILCLAGEGLAQTTAFSYQGRMTDSNLPANSVYDFQFKLFDALSSGTQVGATLLSNNVTVSNGVFTVTLDFGAAAFPVAARFLEISLRPMGAGAFTTLSPRQSITSTPYAIRSLSATTADGLTSACAGCVSSSQIGSLPAGSAHYVQNTTTTQADSNFNISGDGTAGGTLSSNLVNAVTQFNLGGSRLISAAGTNNLFVGMNAAATGPTGFDNTYVGNFAGNASTTGDANSFFGVSAGFNNSGTANSFFGRSAGFQNRPGNSNSFFGVQAGRDNCGVGCDASGGNGSNNSFFGRSAGLANTTGSNNTIIGANANVGADNLTNATAIGAGAIVSASNTLVLGNNANVRIGETTSTAAKFDVLANASNTYAIYASIDGDNKEAVRGVNTSALGFAGYFLGRLRVDGQVSFTQFGTVSGGTPLCRNLSNFISDCSASSLRHKTDVQPLTIGLETLTRLRPISFTWKADGTHDLGLAAEEVAAVEPLLNTYNNKGEIEGVKYQQLTVVLINAVQEQQAQIETLRAANAALQSRLRAVERALRKKPGAAR